MEHTTQTITPQAWVTAHKPTPTPFEQAIDNAINTARLDDTRMIVCRDCDGTGVTIATYDRETGRYDADDCTRCYGLGEHIR